MKKLFIFILFISSLYGENDRYLKSYINNDNAIFANYIFRFEKYSNIQNPKVSDLFSLSNEVLTSSDEEYIKSYKKRHNDNESDDMILLDRKWILSNFVTFALELQDIENQIEAKIIDDILQKKQYIQKYNDVFDESYNTYTNIALLYLRKNELKKGTDLIYECLKNEIRYFCVFYLIKELSQLENKDYLLKSYPLLIDKLKEYAVDYSDLLESLLLFKEFNGVEYENGKRIDIKGIIDNIPNDFLVKESDYITKKTIQQTINDLELNNFKNLDEISELVRNKNSDNKFFVILLVAIFGVFLIKKLKKKNVIKDENIELNH